MSIVVSARLPAISVWAFGIAITLTGTARFRSPARRSRFTGAAPGDL